MSQKLDVTSLSVVSKIIYKNFETHEQHVKQNCVKSSVIALADFYSGYEREIEEMNSELTPTKDDATICDYADMFKAFEEYPTNLHKPKRAPPRELQRMNSTIVMRDMTMMASSREMPSPVSSTLAPALSHRRIALHQPSATEIYDNFKKFQLSLTQFLQESLQQRHTVAVYLNKLEQLCAFAKQLEKLCPTVSTIVSAFTADEESKLRALLKNVEELNYIREHHELFTSASVAAPSPRSDSIVQLITYLLSTICNV